MAVVLKVYKEITITGDDVRTFSILCKRFLNESNLGGADQSTVDKFARYCCNIEGIWDS